MRLFFTCMRQHINPTINGSLLSKGYLEVYPLVELAIVQKHPGDDCLVELDLPSDHPIKEQLCSLLLDCSEGFPKDFVYSITSVKLWEQRYAEQCNNCKYDLIYMFKRLQEDSKI